MYDAAQIRTGFLGRYPLISWRQTPNPGQKQLAADLVDTPTSGRYFNDFHPLLTSTNLLAVAPNFDIYTYPAWSNSTAYVVDDMVKVSGIVYKCVLGHTNQSPPNTTYWQVVSLFSEWLREKTEAGIIQGISTWINSKFEDRTARNLLERDSLFRSAVSSRGKDLNNSKMVGFEFVPMRSQGLQMKITEVSLQFDEDCDVTLYLFSSNSNTPIYAEEINYSAVAGAQWVEVDWTLEGIGSYFVCYDQAENPTVQSINGVPDYTHVTGGGHWLPIGKFFNAASFQAETYATSGLGEMEIGNDFVVGGTKAFGSEDCTYDWETNHGLNFKFSVKCDYTKLILEQKALFQDVVGLSVAIKLLEEMLFNPETNVNRNEANVADKAMRISYELDGDSTSNKKSGLKYKLEQALNAVKFDLTNIDNTCLPCKKRGLRVGTI